MGENYFIEEQRLEIKKIEKNKTNAILCWAGAATAAAISLAVSKIAHESDPRLLGPLMVICAFGGIALVCGGFSIGNFIGMLKHKSRYKWLIEAEENFNKEEKKQK